MSDDVVEDAVDIAAQPVIDPIDTGEDHATVLSGLIDRFEGQLDRHEAIVSHETKPAETHDGPSDDDTDESPVKVPWTHRHII